MNLKYMKVSLFEISYKKKMNFHDILIYWDAPVIFMDLHKVEISSPQNQFFKINPKSKSFTFVLSSYFCLIASNKLCSLWMSCMTLWKALNTIFLSWSSCSYKWGKKVGTFFPFNNCVLYFTQTMALKSPSGEDLGVCALAQKRENAHWNADIV